MIVAYATESQTVPTIREVSDTTDRRKLARALYRAGVFWCEMVTEDRETKDTQT